jgi:hypothetical protein
MKLNHWKFTGSFSIWCYEPNNRNYFGFHCSGNTEGVASIVSLLEIFLLEGKTQSGNLALSSPSESSLRVVGCKSKYISCSKFILNYFSEKEHVNLWSLTSSNGSVELSIGLNTLQQLKDAIFGISIGKGDFCLGERESALWFWWKLKK